MNASRKNRSFALSLTVLAGLSLVRGYFVGSYPYPFIDAAHIGYGRTMLNALGLLIGFIALGLLLVAFGRVRRRIIGR